MKKQTKTTKSTKTKMAVAMNRAVVVHNRRQKILGAIALAGLFFCGFMLGTDVSQKKVKNSTYVEQPSVVVESNEDSFKALSTCQQIESLLSRQLADTNDSYIPNHEYNVYVYTKLVQYGCPENREKYEQMIVREKQIVEALDNEKAADERNCERIETLLKQQIRGLNSPDSYSHIDDAKIYANLSERGCPENSQKYVELAKQELQIARALQDDQFYDEHETIEVVETYKRLNMQAAAEEIFEKAKKLTNPAIDFILQVEKIINE